MLEERVEGTEAEEAGGKVLDGVILLGAFRCWIGVEVRCCARIAGFFDAALDVVSSATVDIVLGRFGLVICHDGRLSFANLACCSTNVYSKKGDSFDVIVL